MENFKVNNDNTRDLCIGIDHPAVDNGLIINGDNTTSELKNKITGKISEGVFIDQNGKKHYDIPHEKIEYRLFKDLLYDLNDGLRFHNVSQNTNYHLFITDEDTYTAMYAGEINPGSFVSITKKYYINYKIVATDTTTHKQVTKVISLENKPVLVIIPNGALGDTLSWFSYVPKFQEIHNCELYVSLPTWFIPTVEKQYPNLHMITEEKIPEIVKEKKIFATYRLGCFFHGDTDHQPRDFREIPLHKNSASILGVDYSEEYPVNFDLSAKRKIKGKYVCLAVQGSAKAKCWNNPTGWYDVIKYLKNNGYRVLCLDRDPTGGDGLNNVTIPFGAEDWTEHNVKLQDRIDIIKDADFFIGLGSGMSWLAWCCRVPVVLISGFSSPNAEFYTPYRVTNFKVCHGCWDDVRENFDHSDYMWCPRHKGTQRQFECTRGITAGFVINVINKVKTFKPKKIKQIDNLKETPKYRVCTENRYFPSNHPTDIPVYGKVG